MGRGIVNGYERVNGTTEAGTELMLSFMKQQNKAKQVKNKTINLLIFLVIIVQKQW
ncbi:MAG: hypothetical protein ACOC40_00470 [Thermoplasmatota archaeon]